MTAAPPPERRRPPAIRRPLQIMALVVLLLIGAVTAQQMLRLRSSMVDGAERQLERLAMVFGEQTSRTLESADLLLKGAAEAAGDSPQADGARAEALTTLLRRRQAGVGQVLEVAVLDPQGRVLAASWTGEMPLPPQATALLGWHTRFQTDEPRVSTPFKMPDGRWAALLSRRIGPPGALGGVALAWINLAFFEAFYRSVELPENGAIILHRRDGVALVRFPHVEAAIGSSFAQTPLFSDILANRQFGTLVMDSPVDGSRRIATIRALRAFPLAIHVSLEQGAVLAPWRDSAIAVVASAMFAAATIGALLLLLARRSGEVERLLLDTRAARDEAEAANARLRDEMEERARAEAVLRQAQRIEVMGQLTGGVAHDFNNLLTVLLGNLELMELDPNAGPRTPDRIAAMRSAAERGAALIAQLLAFSRHAPLQARPVDLNALVCARADLLASAMGSKIRVALNLAETLPAASVDPSQVELMLMNLAINARDAMPAGGVLSITTGLTTLGPPASPAPGTPPFGTPPFGTPEEPPAGDYIMLRVADAGTGMTPDIAARALEPYFTTKGPGGGSGLGLSQVYGVALQSGGTVRLESAPGQGTTVTVLLPRAAPVAVALPHPPTPTPARTEPTRVLLVDDDAAVRLTTALILQDLGYAVLEAEDAAHALEILAEEPIDLLLTDIAMPGLSGPDLARRLATDRPDLPVVFLSGYADPDLLTTTTPGSPPRRLVAKPYRPAELAREIESALDEARSPGARFAAA